MELQFKLREVRWGVSRGAVSVAILLELAERVVKDGKRVVISTIFKCCVSEQ